jgi:hypothetical protein
MSTELLSPELELDAQDLEEHNSTKDIEQEIDVLVAMM